MKFLQAPNKYLGVDMAPFWLAEAQAYFPVGGFADNGTWVEGSDLGRIFKRALDSDAHSPTMSKTLLERNYASYKSRYKPMFRYSMGLPYVQELYNMMLALIGMTWYFVYQEVEEFVEIGYKKYGHLK